MQTGAPVAHEIAPVRHAFVVVQTPSATQGVHVPSLHTMLVPQAMPFACALPVSMHPTSDAVHVVCPTWHGFAGMQAPPPLQPPAPSPPVPASEPPTLPPIDPPVAVPPFP